MSAYSLGTEPMHNVNQLISTMRMYGINVVFDVRNQYEIRKTLGMSKMELRELCPLQGILYINAAEGFSIDNIERKYCHSKGYVSFEKYSSSLAFQTQINKFLEYVQNRYTPILLGFRENVPSCHRFFISSELLKRGVDVLHICPGPPNPHSELERSEVNAAFPVLDQIKLFDVPEESYESKLSKTLKMLNKSIGENWIKEAPLP